MNNNRYDPVRNFTDLKAWQEGHRLVVAVYKATQILPTTERYWISSQLRRAAISITSNVAEGFSRKTYKDKISFLYVSLGSAKEVQNLLLVCRDLNYLSAETLDDLNEQNNGAVRLLMGLIKSFEARLTT